MSTGVEAVQRLLFAGTSSLPGGGRLSARHDLSARPAYGRAEDLKRALSGRGLANERQAETGSLTIAVMQTDAFSLEFSPNATPIALQVPDVGAAKQALEGRGVEFAPETIDSGVCHMAFFEDPDGNALMLHQRYAPQE